MFEERIQYLIERWKKGFGKYESRKAEAVQAAARWEWTTGERYSDLPFHFARFQGRGRVLNEAPTSIGNYLQYGFDEHGRVRLHQAYQYRTKKPVRFLQMTRDRPNLSKDLYSETFYHYTDGQVESIEFSATSHIPLGIQQIFLENGRVNFYDRFKLNGYTPLYAKKGKNPDVLYEWLGYNGRFMTAEEYVYRGNRLTTILGYYEVPGIPPYSTQEQFTYDEAGKLLRIDRVFESGENQVVYRKRLKGQTFKALRAEATHQLVEAIVQRIKAADIREKIYCIVLNYQKVIQHFPPYIVIGPESYRLKAIQSIDSSDRHTIFSPILADEWFFAIDDPETLEMCQILEQEIRSGEKWEIATSILRDVAAALTRYDWSNIVNITSDFVVFALDPEMEGNDIVDVLSSSVSKKQIQNWKEKGWL